MKIPYIHLSFKSTVPSDDYWDLTMLKDMLAGRFGRDVNGYEYERVDDKTSLKHGIVIFPARSQVDCFDRLQRYILDMDWVILCITGDEEATFPFEKLIHENMHIYVMSPRKQDRYQQDNVSFLGTGYSPAIQHLDYIPPVKDLDYFFAGQITHERRVEMDKYVRPLEGDTDWKGSYLRTQSFTSGHDPKDYIELMSRAKVALCPSGPETPDTFRLFEALECGCVPIADTRVPSNKDNSDFGDDYWEYFFGGQVPFPVISDWVNVNGYIQDVLDDYDNISVKVATWWNNRKYLMAQQFSMIVKKLSNTDPIITEPVTILMPTSPIKAHPSTIVIDETIMNTAKHFKQPVQIVVMADGISPAYEQYREQYAEYLRRVLWHASRGKYNVLVFTHEEHLHQANMTLEALELAVATPCILFVEHDAPLVPDYEFDFDHLCQPILKGEANVIRFHHEAQVLDVHRHLMLGSPTRKSQVPLWATRQWSQRPHLANAEFYRTILRTYFDGRPTMIEDVMHGVVDNKVLAGGRMAWYEFRLYMYYPEMKNIKRSYHIDGRAGDIKVIDNDNHEAI